MKKTWLLLLVILIVVLVSSCTTTVVERKSWAAGCDTTVVANLKNREKPINTAFGFSFGRNQTYRIQQKDGTKGRLLFSYYGLSIFELPSLDTRTEGNMKITEYSPGSISLDFLAGPGYHIDLGESKLSVGWGLLDRVFITGTTFQIGIAGVASFHPSISGKYPVGISAILESDLIDIGTGTISILPLRFRGGLFVTLAFKETEISEN